MVAAIGALAMTIGTASAATNGCENEKNDAITAELALCSVHAYNIGYESNPEDAAAKQAMKEVIALKSTVIMQQMYDQYEYMDAILKRFRVQLEKAVLLAKLQQAAGGNGTAASSSGGSYGGGYSTSGRSNTIGRSDTLRDIRDCNSFDIVGIDDAIECIQTHLAYLQQAVDAGDLGAARKQLTADIELLHGFGGWNEKNAVGACKDVHDGKKVTTVCSSGNKTQVSTCLKNFRNCIMIITEQRANNKNNKKSKDD